MMKFRTLVLITCICITQTVGGSVEECGRPAVRPSLGLYIIGGYEARPHSWPWMVSIQTPYLGHICGGSIISDRWILTAAHCINGFDIEWLSVGLGIHRQYVEDSLQEEYSIEKIISHENFTSRFDAEDIALVKLSSNITFNSHIQPVCLPSSGHQWNASNGFVVTGWGVLVENDPEEDPHDVLMQVTFPLVPMETCNDEGWYWGRIDPVRSLCAGVSEGGKDTCQLDSGGPLVTYQDGHWVQAGVVSWGSGCGRIRRPGIYTNVAEFIPWIEENIATNTD